IDEYEPTARPTDSARANSSSAVAPMISEPTIRSDSTGSNATIVVDSERISTALSERFTISGYVDRPVASRLRSFSLILSYKTTLSYTEKPRIVRNAVTVAGLTTNCRIAYTPTLTMMSWMTATMAVTDIFHSKRNVR